MDPQPTLEHIRAAYGENDWAGIEDAANDLLAWIRKGGFIPILTEPQLSTLLIMALGYGRNRVTQQAPE